MRIIQISSATCGPCKMILPIARRYAEETGVPLQYIDIAEAPAFQEKYDIRSVPTFIKLDSEGVELGRVIGADKVKLRALFGEE